VKKLSKFSLVQKSINLSIFELTKKCQNNEFLVSKIMSHILSRHPLLYIFKMSKISILKSKRKIENFEFFFFRVKIIIQRKRKLNNYYFFVKTQKF